jgi:hypothetical protein
MRFYRITQEWRDQGYADRCQIVRTLAACAALVREQDYPELRVETLVEQVDIPSGADTIATIWNGGPECLPAGTLISRLWRGTKRGGLRELDPANIDRPLNESQP